MAFRDRLQAYQNEQERARAERDYQQRREGGMQERARQREAAAAEERRARVEAERTARREALSRSRAQAEVERFNRPSRLVPYEERLPTAPPREAAGGGGGRIPPSMPGAGALPAPEGNSNLPAQRSGVPARIPQQLPMTLGAPGIRPPMGAGAAGAVLGAGLMARDMADEYIRRDREARAERSPAMEGARIGGTADREARRQAFEEQENARRMNEADADSARTAPPARRERPAPRPRRQQGESEADRLNAISQAFIRGERPRGGAADVIGKAMGIEGYKKGGLIGKRKVAAKKVAAKAVKPVKKAAGGSIKAPKVPGRPAGRPATAVKAVGTPRMAKAMQGKKPVAMPAFKKGGKVAAKKRK